MEAVLGVAGARLLLDPLENIGIDNGWDRGLNNFIVGFSFVCFRRCLIELPSSDVNGVRQQLVYVTNAETVVPASSISTSIQPFDYFFNTKRT